MALFRAGYKFQVGDKVMQTRNNYKREVFNGDIGYIQNIDFEEQQVLIRFDEEMFRMIIQTLMNLSLHMPFQYMGFKVAMSLRCHAYINRSLHSSQPKFVLYRSHSRKKFSRFGRTKKSYRYGC